MKISFIRSLILVSIVLLFSCKKEDNADSFNPDFTLPSGASPVNSILLGYVMEEDNDPPAATIYTGLNNNNYACTNNMFSTGTSVPADRYLTKMGISGAGYYHKSNKTFPVSSSAVNYVNIKTLGIHYFEFLYNSLTSTHNIATGASISFPANALWQPAQATFSAEYDPYMMGNLTAAYLDPTDNEFGNRTLCYNMADDDQKRWFLRSYGVTHFEIRRSLGPNTYLDLYNNATATVKVPIHPGLLSTAPEFITLWRLDNGVWVNGGSAKKTGSYYEGAINKIGTWNFAFRQDGIYKTVRLRTTDGAPVVNAGIRIKSGIRVLFQAQTDGDGNAVCFIPAKETVNIEVVDSWVKNSSVISTVSAPASGSQYIDVSLSTLSPRVQTIKGNVTNCNGAPVSSGLILLNFPYNGPSDYIIPFSNGKFNAAMVYTSGAAVCKVRAKSISNEEGVDSAVYIHAGQVNQFNLNTCIPPTNLYINYSVDGTNYSITTTGSIPGIFIWGSPSTGQGLPTTWISCTDNAGKNIEFSVETTSVGINAGMGVTQNVNGVGYLYEYLKPHTAIFTRYDALAGGYIIGSVDFYAKDYANVSHRIIANFKVLRHL